MFEKILVPTDGSEYADRAVEVALGLARELGTRVVALHVLDEKLILPLEVLEEEGRHILEEVRRRGEEMEVPVDEIILFGNPRQDMAKITTKSGADLMIIGTHGRTGVEKLLLGSVAENALKTVEVPVMLVK
ncbi:MAG: universal stress protein [Euryarchaeota archaeon]|jgi:nucleotide-binding universal stress UspA family protein|nr:universal stress protein [Euryarchaeota archaeon]